MWRNRGMGIASVSSISAVLMILGVVLILVLSINNAVLDTKLKFDEVEVFLVDDLSNESMDRIEENVKDFPGVISILFRSKEQALEIMKEEWADEAYLLDGLETNPLPDSYIIKVNDIEYADGLVNSVKTLDGVEEVKYYKDVIDKLLVFAGYIQLGGIMIIGILVFISVFIISNTIKITVSSRRREINIMKYVGATNGYIRGPFIMEGIFLGIIGALISIIIVYFGYQYLYRSMNEKLYDLFTFYLVDPKMIFADLAIMFGTIGSGIGALGSLVSLKRFLNV
ncbi:MAG: permease-like cell division protein FtsX [Bacillota bacterium]